MKIQSLTLLPYLDSGSTPTHILTDADANTLLSTTAMVGDLIFPKSVADLGWAGLTQHATPRILINPNSITSSDVYAHEIGHYAGGLSDWGNSNCMDGCVHVLESPPTPYDLMLLMYHSSDRNTNQNILREFEADGYEHATH